MMSRVQRVPERTTLLRLLSATVLTLGGGVLAAAPASAQEPPPAPLHDVKYTIFAEQPTHVDIYFRDVDPPNWAAYSHNPYVFSPKVKANVGPDTQWNLDVQLANPDEWAMVTATSGQGSATPNVHCVLAVDGVVVSTHQGPKGALCSIRNW
ncbi:hypothetical protein [Mycolicibacterium sp. XJ1819]